MEPETTYTHADMCDHEDLAVERVGCYVVTVSDSRTPETDESGRLIVEALQQAGHEVKGYTVVPDEPGRIRSALEEALADPEVDAVILNGGTGISPRDATPEAVKPLLEKELPGFGEAFRRLSTEEIGPRALLSRATAGIARGKLIFALPGSPHGVSLALEKLIIPLLGHAVFELRRKRAR
jgi:molybdenum cofactor biosynthesis protein B